MPWEASSGTFTGRITHHEEAARIRALQREVDAAVAEIESSMDEPSLAALQHAVDDAAAEGAAAEASPAGVFIKTSIQRVFGNNFKGDESEPQAWSAGGEQWGRLGQGAGRAGRVLADALRQTDE